MFSFFSINELLPAMTDELVQQLVTRFPEIPMGLYSTVKQD